MTSLHSILAVGSSALTATQTAINVTSNNIANVNTEGYCRQVVSFSATEPIETSYGQAGTGVTVDSIERVYDAFVTNQINSASQDLGEYEARAGTLEIVETVFNESTGNGLNEVMSDFWNAWQDLANDPSGHAERTVLAEISENLATTFNDMASDLVEIRQDIDANIETTVDEINQIAEQIADLNENISQCEEIGISANEYQDSRDQLISELSTMINLSVSENGNGMVSVHVGDGNALVEGTSCCSLNTEPNAETGLLDVTYTDSSGSTSAITGGISGGELAGWLEARDVDIPEYMDALDELAVGIMTEVNALQSTGFGLDGSTENDFFTGTSATDMAVNQDILDDVNLIAASDSAGGVPGDAGNAIAIADLQNGLLMDGANATFDEYYNSLVSNVGATLETAQTNLSSQTETLEYLENYRESISGISLDEENINLIKYQNAYEAAAMLISIVDELMDTVIDLVN